MKTAKELAYEEIRKRIFSGAYDRGEQLKEEDLAKLLGVSRTPVRQAIQKLADQGLVTVKSNHRTYVSDVTETQFEEIFDILSFLESYSASLAATRITKEEISELQSLNDDINEAVTNSPDDLNKFLNINAKFHDVLHKASGNDKLYDLIQRVIEFPHNLYLKFNQINATHNPKSLDEHQMVIDALKNGDREFSGLAMKMHTEAVRRSFRELWSKLPDDDT